MKTGTIGVATCVLVFAAAAQATPIVFRDIEHKPLPGKGRWPDGSTINVIVQKDPAAGGTRHDDVKTGMERWKGELEKRGVKMNVVFGDPRKDIAQNPVRVEWVNRNNLERGGLAETFPRIRTKKEFAGTFLEHEVIDQMSSALVRLPQDLILNASGWRNLAMHEFGHALGLADEPTQKDKPHNVMDTNVQTRAGVVMAFTERDIAEMNTLYGNPQGEKPRGAIQGGVRQLAGGLYHYEYLVSWLGGPEIPLVQIPTNGHPVTHVMAEDEPAEGTSAFFPTSTGWFFHDPRDPSSEAGFIDDIVLPPVATGDALEFLSFVNSIKPLGPDLVSFTFSFDSPLAPGLGLAYASGDEFFIVPAPVPLPSTLALLALGVVGLASLRISGRGRPLRFA